MSLAEAEGCDNGDIECVCETESWDLQTWDCLDNRCGDPVDGQVSGWLARHFCRECKS